MSADWKLQQAMTAYHAGVSAILADDPDAPISPDNLPDEIDALETAVRRLIAATQDADDLASAARERARQAAERARRFDARSDRYRGLLLAVMDAMGWRKREWPEATVSLRAPQPGVMITAADELPEAFVRITRTPDKEAIRTALKAGNPVPGAVLSNGLPGLTIRSN